MANHWSQIIEPHYKWYDVRLKELWRYRELILLFVWRDFVAVYKQTVLGPLWHLIQPILTSIMFTVVFGKVARIPTDGIPPFIFYMSGTIMWTYFAASLTKTSSTFITNANLFGKVYFPRLVTPISILISNLVSFVIQFTLFVFVLIYYILNDANVHPNAWVLLSPLLLLMLAGFGLGFGMIISSLTTKYRDLHHLIGFGVQLWMFATPVIYPASILKGMIKIIIFANPITPIMEAFRYAFFGVGTVNIASLSYSFSIMLVILFIGIITFNRIEKNFIDTI